MKWAKLTISIKIFPESVSSMQNSINEEGIFAMTNEIICKVSFSYMLPLYDILFIYR